MKEYIGKLKEIETLVELSIGTTMTEETFRSLARCGTFTRKATNEVQTFK